MIPLQDWTERAAPIDLESLRAQADLQTRTDRKYLLAAAEAHRVLALVADDAQILQIDGRRCFGYASVYFDTAGLEAYHRTATRRRRRFKVRTRSYLDSGEHWVEVKTAGPRGATVKQRQPLSSADPARLSATDLEFVDEGLVAAGVGRCPVGLRPVLRTSYHRSTLALPEVGARVTLDTRLRWQGCDQMVLSAPGLAVVETKGGASPSPVDRLLWAAGHRPRPLSKYGTGLALLRPEAPASRWHRTLRQITAHAADEHAG